MNKNILFDTDIVIELLRNHNTTVQTLLTLQQQSYEFYICPIVIAEIYAGAFPKEFSLIEQFFSFCHTLTIDNEIGKIGCKIFNYLMRRFKSYSILTFAPTPPAIT